MILYTCSITKGEIINTQHILLHISCIIITWNPVYKTDHKKVGRWRKKKMSPCNIHIVSCYPTAFFTGGNFFLFFSLQHQSYFNPLSNSNFSFGNVFLWFEFGPFLFCFSRLILLMDKWTQFWTTLPNFIFILHWVKKKRRKERKGEKKEIKFLGQKFVFWGL